MRKISKKLFAAAGALFLAMAAVLATAGTMAHFESTILNQVIPFYARPLDQMSLLPADATVQSTPVWSREDGIMTMGFRVAGVIDPAKPSQPYYVRLYVDDGIPAAKLTVTLTANSQTFTGRATAIKASDPLYREMGPGYLYSFYLGSAAQEVQWNLQNAEDIETPAESESSAMYSRSFEVKITGVGDAPVMTELCVEGVTAEPNENSAQDKTALQSAESEAESEASSAEGQSEQTVQEQEGSI